MRKKYLLLMAMCCLVMLSMKAQEVAEVVKAYPQGKAVVVEYDLAFDADFVRLYVSLDGGVTYRGPLQQVSGEIADVKAGFNHRITWNVLNELNVEKFESDQVRFKLNIKLKDPWPSETFVLLNAAYSPAPQGSMGLTFGRVKRFGWFISVMTNGSFSGFGYDGDCNANGFLPDGHLMQYTGKVSKMRLSVMAGGVMRVASPLCIKVGIGYGNRTSRWETVEGKWYRNTAFSQQGIDLSAGAQLHWHGFAASLEAVTTQFQNVELKIGIGYVF